MYHIYLHICIRVQNLPTAYALQHCRKGFFFLFDSENAGKEWFGYLVDILMPKRKMWNVWEGKRQRTAEDGEDAYIQYLSYIFFIGRLIEPASISRLNFELKCTFDGYMWSMRGSGGNLSSSRYLSTPWLLPLRNSRVSLCSVEYYFEVSCYSYS